MTTLLKLIIIFFFVAIFLDPVGGSYSSKLYPFGKDVDDLHLPVKDDVSSDAISTPPFWFFGLNVSTIYVHENGLISFGSTLNDQSPASFPLTNEALAAAPYWADVYTERGGRVWYRKTTDDAIVSRATRDVIRAFPRYTGYMASWVVIVTWDEVTFYAASGIYTQNRNTFQVFITSDGVMSFAGYIYDNLSWTSDTLNGAMSNGLGGKPAQIGFIYEYSYHKLSVSGTDGILGLVNTSNCGQPGVWLFRIDDVKKIDENMCESKGTLSIHPTIGRVDSGTNLLISGLCYRPGAEVRCDFGELGTVTGRRINETKAVCSVPLTTTSKEVTLFLYSTDDVNLKMAQVFLIEPPNFYDAYIQRGDPKLWTFGNRVGISWDSQELAVEHVMVEIINLFDGQEGIKVHSNITVVSDQLNTGKAEFDLPNMETLRKDHSAPKLLHTILVRSLQNNAFYKYVSKEWIGSDFFHLTNETLANKSCTDWIRSQENNLSFMEGYGPLTPCPKTRRQMEADMGRFVFCELCDVQILPLCKIYYKNVDICYKTQPFWVRGLQRKCCYDNEGELTAGPLSGITDPKNSIFALFKEDFLPYLECCMFSDNCFKYQELLTSGSLYIPPNIGASFGDPHIISFDGVEYTFNGFGEYTVLSVNNSQFVLQGRMQPLNGGQNGKSPATVFTAFAMTQQGGSLIQVQRNELQLIEVLIDGIPSVIEHNHELQSAGVFIRNSTRGSYPRVILAFSSGITVYVESAAVLQMAVAVPVEFKGKTNGLLGYWDDNVDKEYLLPNKVFLNTASTMSEIHHEFGQRWATKKSDSLFTYNQGKMHEDYFDTSYVPTFMESYDPIIAKMNNGERKRALMTCEQSFQCIFDIAVTGRLDVGKATKEFQEWLLGVKRDLHDEGCSVTLSLVGGSVQTNVTGDLVTHSFTCNQGYVMAGKNTISCRGGFWYGSKPTCYRVSTTCKPLTEISFPNGNFHGQGSMLGDRYQFKCDWPFTLIGNEEVVCGKDGFWSGKVPFCQRRNCSQVSIANAKVLVGNEGDLVIRCNEGYNLIGSNAISCLPNGLLNGTLPSCGREQARRDPAGERGIPRLVIVIGVVVIIITIIVVVVTIYLVRKHRRRKATQVQKKPAEAQEEISV